MSITPPTAVATVIPFLQVRNLSCCSLCSHTIFLNMCRPRNQHRGDRGATSSIEANSPPPHTGSSTLVTASTSTTVNPAASQPQIQASGTLPNIAASIQQNSSKRCFILSAFYFDSLIFVFSPKRKAATVDQRGPARARLTPAAVSNHSSSKRVREADSAIALRSQRNLRNKK